ncbi:MAG: hypothetical protein NVSMB32_00030 [Actinomycetota bacterium]
MTIPVPVLDDRTFEQILAEAKARIPVHTPEWTNLNESDPGITILELFAFLTDNLLYRGNRIPEANRRKFLSMLGISLRPASPGIGLVAFHNDRGPLQPLLLAAGSPVTAGKVPFRTQQAVDVLPVTSTCYYKRPRANLDAATRARYRLLYATFLTKDADVLTFYDPVALEPPLTGKPGAAVDLGDATLGTIDHALWVALLAPKGADLSAVRAAIATKTLTIGVYPAPHITGQTLLPDKPPSSTTVTDPGLIVEIAAPATGATGQSGAGPANYQRLPIVYANNVLQTPGLIQVTLPTYDRLRLWNLDPEEEGTGDFPPRVEDQSVARRIVTWIRLRFAAPTAAVTAAPGGSTSQVLAGAASASEASARLSWVGVNVATVVQAVPVVSEILGLGTGTPYQSFTVANAPVIVGLPYTCFTLEVQQVDGSWLAWSQTDDLAAAKANDSVYLLEPASGQVTCGSGLTGARFPLGQAVRASYEFGGGEQGNIAIGDANKSPVLPGGFSVTNPVATWGADNGENVAEGEANISRWLRHRDRLVTAADFRDVTARTPGIDLGRVEILPLFDPNLFDPAQPGQTWPGMVTIMVIPHSDADHPQAPVPDRQFLAAVCAWLDPRRLITTELHVRGPQYVKMWASVGIQVLAGELPDAVVQRVNAAVTGFLSPLVGGLPPTGAADGCAQPQPTPDCTPPGTGWPLSSAVRSRDIEAVATRVAGVRYVDSVSLAWLPVGGTVITGVSQIPLIGLQLPDATVFVTNGPAEDPASLIGSSQPVSPTQVPVPVVPASC